MNNYLATDAVFSDCQRYRWLLMRRWSDGPHICMFIGLNPSTADYYNDDPTVRRCVGFARQWGYSAMYMMNAYAFRSTNPKVMKQQSDPVGCQCDDFLKGIALLCRIHVACWGTNIETYRQTELKQMLPRLKCFGITAKGFPKHPLYLSKATKLIAFV